MTSYDQPEWHRDVINAATESTLRALDRAKLLSRFYLAGGTGLALQIGHRLSLDLDFFSLNHFDEEVLLQRVQVMQGFALVSKAPYTLHCTLETTKVSFLGYAYPSLHPASQFLGVPVADPRDIACMKVSAIASRGTKRDFIDLYLCVQRYGLKEVLEMFDRKYAQTNYSKVHILKSLTYFDDADKDPLPHMLVPLDWPGVKQFFAAEVPEML